MEHPLFDSKQFSFEQLIEKTSELQQRIVYARMYGMDDTAIEQLESILESLQLEQMDRFKRMEYSYIDGQFPDVIETDPSMKDEKNTVKVNTNPFRKNISKHKNGKSNDI
jgi:cyanate lyase